MLSVFDLFIDSLDGSCAMDTMVIKKCAMNIFICKHFAVKVHICDEVLHCCAVPVIQTRKHAPQEEPRKRDECQVKALIHNILLIYC